LELADHAGVSIAAAREMADAARATVSAVRHRIARTLAARAQEARETAEARARVAAPPPDDDEPGTWPAPLMPRPRVNPPAGAVARLEF
jgi:hypothetical protein